MNYTPQPQHVYISNISRIADEEVRYKRWLLLNLPKLLELDMALSDGITWQIKKLLGEVLLVYTSDGRLFTAHESLHETMVVQNGRA